ncbi:S9 family peptidase [Flavobacterium sp. SE-1-e]|uniref:S9 family peptidase n=2 Tax=Flavobacterium agrisoli TaxID=2793066 RepID=A0A934UHY2_9FLAO|nr:S9 family peptidase [Flavobacterium agrisoli]
MDINNYTNYMNFYNQIIRIQKCCWVTFFMKATIFLLFILQLVTCPLRGQELQKRNAQSSDYHRWSDMYMHDVSPDGKWVLYQLDYDHNMDTMVVRSTTFDKKYNFKGLKRYNFLNDEGLVTLRQDYMEILNLKKGSKKRFDKVTNYAYSESTHQIVMLTDDGKNKKLSILDPKGKVLKEKESVSFFSMSPDGLKIVYVTKSDAGDTLGIMDIKAGYTEKILIANSTAKWDNFVWQQSKALSYLQHNGKDSKTTLSYYNLQRSVLKTLDPMTQSGSLGNIEITTYYLYPMMLSDDGESVFFATKRQSVPSEKKDKNEPQIWYAGEKVIYSRQERTEDLKSKPNLAVWYPMSGSFRVISSPEFSEVFLTGNQQYALLADPLLHEPAMELEVVKDFFIKDLKTGTQELLVKNIIDLKNRLLPSPSGKYIAYFLENDWWIYDVVEKKHTNITAEIDTDFSEDNGNIGVGYPCGNPGWTDGDQEILLYDQFDIWAVKPNGTWRKLTSGREKEIQFRFAYNIGSSFKKQNFDGAKRATININKDIILSAKGIDKKSGYFLWSEKTKEKCIVYEDAMIDNMHYIEKAKTFIYQKQNFDKSPFLVRQSQNKEPNVFYESNKHQHQFKWGKAELVSYKNSKGKLLHGALYYPAGYNPQKKYPMIVHVYEKQSQNIHNYIKPTLFNLVGFNPTVLTLQGYFVLRPDIDYEIGKPGESAVDCVTAATKAVIDKGIVVASKIGLMGHSFGGYETSFIVGKTNMFAAAIAGAPPTDLYSFYHSIDWDKGKANMTKFNVGQLRLGVSAFQAPEIYMKNSPLASAQAIDKPLLIWSGKNDNQVDWHQSIELYVAMHRLKKKSVMILYPEEGHSFMKPENQKDLSTKILQWFDYFLKEEKQTQWISKQL